MQLQIIAATLGIAGAGLALGMGGSAAHAGDAKVYPGSACVHRSGPTPTYRNGGIFNPSTTGTLFLDCVAIHDGGSITSAWMKVKDLSPVSAVKCRLLTRFANGSGGFSGGSANPNPPPSNGGFGTLWQTLTFPGVASNARSHQFFSCTIPPDVGSGQSGIGTYQIEE